MESSNPYPPAQITIDWGKAYEQMGAIAGTAPMMTAMEHDFDVVLPGEADHLGDQDEVEDEPDLSDDSVSVIEDPEPPRMRNVASNPIVRESSVEAESRCPLK